MYANLEKLLSAVFVGWASKLKCLYIQVQCESSPAELTALSILTFFFFFKKNLSTQSCQESGSHQICM